MCRICLECDRVDSLIAPCRCMGTSRWVHHTCLDTWRATNEDLAFSRCMECHFEYRLVCDSHLEPQRKRTYRLYVARDLIVSLFLLLTVVTLLSALVWAFGFRGPTTTTYSGPTGCGTACQVGYSVAGGVCILLSFLGVYGIYILCVNDCRLDGAAIAGNTSRQHQRTGVARGTSRQTADSGIVGAHLQ
jgi:hypothetical protein